MTLTNEETLTVLKDGKVTVQGEFLWGSNYTFLVQVEHEGTSVQAVYKPTRGERPLWDFPVASLANREVAAYLVSEALGWELVPPTTFRRKGPIGAGSIQLYIEHDPEYHYFTFQEEDQERLRPAAVFDLLINNADRKGSHILIDPQNHIWLIDHGVCFHMEDKLRTVIWDFAGERLPEDLCSDLHEFHRKLIPQAGSGLDGERKGKPSELATNLARYLSNEEINALAERTEALIKSGIFPPPNPYRRPYPWPQL